MHPDSVGLTASLVVVFFIFCLMMAGVLWFCLKERRKIDGLGVVDVGSRGSIGSMGGLGDLADPRDPIDASHHQTINSSGEQFIDNLQDAEDDKRVATVLFGAIIGGAVLALITGYLVFFRTW